MADQFNEFYHGKTGLTVEIKSVLFSEKSKYQKVEVFDTDSWGNLLVLDGMVMLSEKDEFVYHEMISHVGMLTHPQPQRVLVVGGGDGGTAREVLRHPGVRQVDMIEIDETVIRASKTHFPGMGNWEDQRLNIVIDDGIQYVRLVEDPYDVIIIDGSDPVGPAEGLFNEAFIRSCHSALAGDGVIVFQSESPWVEAYRNTIRDLYSAVDMLFDVTRMYLAPVPLYPAGLWSFIYAGKVYDPLSESAQKQVRERIGAFGNGLSYYNEKIHTAAFGLPNFVKDIIGSSS